jgi:hypothetical protein
VAEQAAPVDGRAADAEQVEQAGDDEPAGVERPLPQVRPLKVAGELPADEDQDGQAEQPLDGRPPAATLLSAHERDCRCRPAVAHGGAVC